MSTQKLYEATVPTYIFCSAVKYSSLAIGEQGVDNSGTGASGKIWIGDKYGNEKEVIVGDGYHNWYSETPFSKSYSLEVGDTVWATLQTKFQDDARYRGQGSSVGLKGNYVILSEN